MGVLDQKINKSIPANLLRQREGRRLVDPHQWRMNHETALHAEIERELHGFDRVVAAVGIAGEIGLAHAGDQMLDPAPIGERARERQEREVAAGNKGGRQPARVDFDCGLARERGLLHFGECIELNRVILAK